MDAAAKLRAARLHAGLTQQQLAELSGVRQPNIAAYERGLRNPSPLMLQRLLDAARPRPSVILNANRAKIREIAARHHAHNVRVFGSVARNTDRPNSDLDLLVAFDDAATLVDQAALVDELQDLLGVPIDVVSDRALRDRDVAIRAEAVPV
ncbi:MAG TPA: helix-turn-helix domain-containing protein [Propionibacteriaceae bacterium]